MGNGGLTDRHGCAFTKSWLGYKVVTRSDKDPEAYLKAATSLAPEATVRIVEPGIRVEL